MTIDAHAAVRAADARVVHADALPGRLRFSTDTRSIADGDAFVALRGERFDGHAFARDALASGAAALVVSDPSVVPAGVPALVVADTTVAYLAFAGVARRELRGRVVAITGSAGKTTTKAFLAQILASASQGLVVATPANENNEIGVAKLLLGAPADAAFVVVEFGARHFGEIAPLARAARPDVAVLTNVGEAHLELMGSRERLSETKWGIFATGARPVLNAADDVSRERARSLPDPVTWFDARPGGHGLELHGGERSVALARVRDAIPRDVLSIAQPPALARAFPTDVAVGGDYNRDNVAAACAAAFALGIEPAAVARALPALELPAGRYERLEAGGLDLIYDAYNASPAGMEAALASFAREPGLRRIAVLASMAELGETEAPAIHERVGGAAARSNLDVLLVGGEFAPDLQRGARAAGFAAERIVPFATNAVAVAWLRANARPGDLVLLKGARRYHLEDVVAGLRG